MITLDATTIPKKGTDIELSIESLAFGGMGVSRIGDMIVFVKNSIPGQTVLARVTKKRSSFLEAQALEIIKESTLAVDDHWSVRDIDTAYHLS